MSEIILISIAIFIIVFFIATLTKQPNGLTDIYEPAHIADFVAFAKTQLYLPKIKAIKAIRIRFAHLTLQQAVEVYELAHKENDHK